LGHDRTWLTYGDDSRHPHNGDLPMGSSDAMDAGVDAEQAANKFLQSLGDI